MTHITWRGTWNGRSPQGLAHKRARTIIRTTGGIFRGKFPSRKTGRMVHHEGLLELDAIYHFETSPLIACYTEQPATICYADGGRLRRYTPDFELQLTSGESILVEVKPSRFALEAETRHKLNRVAEHFERQGQRHVVLTDEVLRHEPRLNSLRRIYHLASRLSPSFVKCEVELKRIASLFPLRIEEAEVLLAGVGLDPYSLLMNGLLQCDLSKPVDPNSHLLLASENDHAWFRLSDRFNF